VVSRRREAQDADATHGSVLLPPAALGRASDRSQPWQRAAVVYPAGKCCRTKAEVSIGCDYTRGAVTAAPAATRGAARVRTRARTTARDVACQLGGGVLAIPVPVQLDHLQRQPPPGPADLPHDAQDLGALEAVGDRGHGARCHVGLAAVAVEADQDIAPHGRGPVFRHESRQPQRLWETE